MGLQFRINNSKTQYKKALWVLKMHKRIKLIRKKAGLNQAELGKILGIGQKAVSMIEAGTNQPTAAQIEKLSQFFNVSTDYLFFGYETVRPEEQKILKAIREDKGIYAAMLRVAKSKNDLNAIAA